MLERKDTAVESAWVVANASQVRYQVIEVLNLFDRDENVFLHVDGRGISKSRRVLVFVDEVVNRLYGQNIRGYFGRVGISVDVSVVPARETNKNMHVVFSIAREMDGFRLSRRSDSVIAIGGGVVMDLVGFAASLFRRGIPYLRVPTTLMGLIDAGIGIKTGIDFDRHKNRLGTYYAPKAVYLDASFLATLDDREFCNGVAEIVKIGLVKDNALLGALNSEAAAFRREKGLGGDRHRYILRQAISGMLEELEDNLWEDRLERVVDFGHTFSPAIEMARLPGLLHGEAVSIDMAICLGLARNRNLITAAEFSDALLLLATFDLPVFDEVCTPGFLERALADATLHRDGLQRVPLPGPIGSHRFVNDISTKELAVACADLEEFLARRQQRGLAYV